MSLTDDALRKINAVSGEYPVLLLQIDHSGLSTPARFAQNSENVISNGDTYLAVPFEIKPPDDLNSGASRGRLSVTNVGETLMEWIETSGGGVGATVTLSRVMFDDPNTIQWQVDGLIFSDIKATSSEVSGTLSWEDLLSVPAVARRYDPATQPGVF